LIGYALVGGLLCVLLDVSTVVDIFQIKLVPVIRSKEYELISMRSIGYNLLGLGIVWSALTFFNTDIVTATGWTSAAGFLFFAASALRREIPKDVGMTGIYIWMLICACTAVSILA
jgi:hypothetical protein